MAVKKIKTNNALVAVNTEKFTKDSLSKLRKDIQDALDAVALKNDLASLDLGPIRFGDCEFTSSITAKTKDQTNSLANKYFELRFGKPLVGVGFVYNGQNFVIKDYKNRSPKYPVVCSVDGKKGNVCVGEELVKIALKIK